MNTLLYKKMILIIFLIISILPTICTSFLCKKVNNDDMYEEIYTSLYTIGKTEQKEIINSFNQIKNDLKLISELYSSSNLDKNKVNSIIDLVKLSHRNIYIEIFVLNKKYNLLYGYNLNRENFKEKKHVNEALKGTTSLSKTYINEKECYIELAFPIYKNSSIQGCICAKINLQFLNKIISNCRIINESSESYIVNKEGKFLTESKFIPNAIMKEGVDINKIKYNIDYSPKNSYLDYREKEVYGIYFSLPYNNWTLIVEENKKALEKSNDKIAKIGEIMTIAETIILSINRIIFNKIEKSNKNSE